MENNFSSNDEKEDSFKKPVTQIPIKFSDLNTKILNMSL